MDLDREVESPVGRPLADLAQRLRGRLEVGLRGVAARALRAALATALRAGTIRQRRRGHDRRIDHRGADPGGKVDDLAHALANARALLRVRDRPTTTYAHRRDPGVSQLRAKVARGRLVGLVCQPAPGGNLDAFEAGLTDQL